MPTYDVPGVYIEEQTNPGVITGVGTSTAAFIGPALRGALNEARFITSFDEFLQSYGIQQPDGTFWPYITSPRNFFMAHAVRGFFDNGGRQAYIVRIGTGRSTTWRIQNQDNEEVLRIQAKEEGVGGDNITVQVQAATATGAAGRPIARGEATVNGAPVGLDVVVSDASQFRIGDVVTEDETARATITGINSATNTLTLSNTIANLGNTDTLRIANLIPAQSKFRMGNNANLYPGSVVLVKGSEETTGAAIEEYAVIESVDRNGGFVTLAPAPLRTKKFDLRLTAPTAPVLVSQEFRLIVTANGVGETADNLSLSPLHPRFVFSAASFNKVRLTPPLTPATSTAFPGSLVKPVAGNVPPLLTGVNDDPGAATATEYQRGLDILKDVDDVNLLCIPDAAANADNVTIRQAMITHCLAPGLQDRFAILDTTPGATSAPSGAGSVGEQVQLVRSARGFAALYYPWLKVREPLLPDALPPPTPRTIMIPPSGHMAGIYARTDQERGVHKAPANTEVRGVLGLEQVLSNGQHGPLNLIGINVLRIFPGSAQVIVWGARTTVDPANTDWIYVNVRRLMLFLEESIEESLKFSAVFEPNNLALWEKLKRILNEFLERVWRDGALFGAKPEQAFRVRIDEALNPASTRALGRLYIEISVAAVRPAEFIIVRIGLSRDGASEVSEG